MNEEYTLSELLFFFDLKKENLTREIIEKKADELLDKVIDKDDDSSNDSSDDSSDDSNNTNKENNITKKINFIMKIKNNLLKHIKSESTNFILGKDTEKPKQKNKKLSVSEKPHFIQPTNNIKPNHFNSSDNIYKLKNLVFSSFYCNENLTQNKDDLNNPYNSIYTFTLPQKIKEVVGIKLKAVQYPNIQYTISPKHNNNQLYIKIDGTGIQGLVVVPYGKYFFDAIAPVLQKEINLSLYPNKPAGYTIFTVIYDYNTTSYVITNTKNQKFTIYFDTSQFFENSETQLAQCGYVPYNNLNGFYDNYNKNDTLQIYTLGYMLGYRKKVYSGEFTYKANSGIQLSDLEQYYYFNVDDFNVNRVDNISAVFGNSLQSKDILGVIPVAAKNERRFFGNIILDTGANYIFRSRNYTTPVDIEKIQVSFYGPDFSLLDLEDNGFMFIIEFKMLYDSNKDFDKKMAFG